MKKTILLTGDDGYNSMGTRLLIKILKDEYDLKIAGTKTQQSAVGGKMSLKGGFDWKKTEVDGVEALCVDGTPVDAIELGDFYFQKKFDLVISGINWGANLGSSIHGSGTVGAAIHAVNLGMSDRVIAFSWDLPIAQMIKDHGGDESLDDYLKYPGQAVIDVMDYLKRENFFSSTLINVNFPQEKSTKIRLSKVYKGIKEIWKYDYEKFDKNDNHFSYGALRVVNPIIDDIYDAKAIADGFISVSPCDIDFTDLRVFS